MPDDLPPFDARTILLVDDSDDDVFLMQRSFAKAGIGNPLQVVADGEQALAYLEGHGDYSDRQRFPLPALVLLDLNLPRRSGLEVLQRLRAHATLRFLPVYVLTASARIEDCRQARKFGADAYLIKPGRVEELVELARAVAGFGRRQWLPELTELAEGREGA